MKQAVVFLGVCAALVLLAAVAFGAMVSIKNGRPSWLLIGVFVLDSLALLVFAGYFVLRRCESKKP